jgi:hypothetical protein
MWRFFLQQLFPASPKDVPVNENTRWYYPAKKAAHERGRVIRSKIELIILLRPFQLSEIRINSLI